MKKFIKVVLTGSALLFAGVASAIPTTAICEDDPNIITNPQQPWDGKVRDSSIDALGDTTLNISNCGPHLGGDNDLTRLLGGYGEDLYSATNLDGWQLLDKTESGGDSSGLQDGAISITFDGGNWSSTSGTFSFDSTVNYDDYLILMKFDGVYSTFLSDTEATNWLWDTDVDSDNFFALSHLTVFVRNPSEVPEPALVGLLAIGLLGMVVARRKATV